MKSLVKFSRIGHLRLVILLVLIFAKVNSQSCSGSFGNPIFTENFGAVNTPSQTISPPLAAPASTNYQYVSVYPPNDGQYTITNQAEFRDWGFINSLDHTNDPPGTYGNMLVVNASYAPGEFYRRRVSNLCPNQFYQFSAWILNLHSSGTNIIRPNVTFQIRTISGTVIGSISSGDIAEDSTWKNFSIDFKSDINSTAVDVVLINNSPGGNGNDLAIDDITFSPCGPATDISADLPDVFTTGICDNSQSFQIEANLSTNTFLNVNYIWQKSTDNGVTWVDVTPPTSNPKLNISAGTYQNNDQYRFIVGESANILSANCQVISKPITVKINGYPDAPIVESPLNYCQNSVATALNVTGTNLIWYTSAIGGTGNPTAPIPDTSEVGTFSFFVSQVRNGCEGPRSKIVVKINANPTAPVVNSPVDYCQNAIAAALTATGKNLLWYTSATGGTASTTAPIPDTSVSGTFFFWVSQSVNGCESMRSEIKVIIKATPDAPIVISPVNYCENFPATALTATGINLLWYTAETGGVGSPNAPIPGTSSPGGFSFWVSQTVNSCESQRVEIKVNVVENPKAPIVDSPINYCQNSPASALTASGTNLLWYTSATGGTANPSAPIPNTSLVGKVSFWVSQTVNGCESARSEIVVNVSANAAAPTVVSSPPYCQNSVAIALSATGTNLLWYTSEIGGTASTTAPIPNTSASGNFSFWVSQSINGCESPRSEINIIVLPEPHSSTLADVSICNDETITLDAGNGFKSYEWNTTPPTFTQTLQVSKIGTYSVTLTNYSNCSATQAVNVTAGITPTIVNIIATDNSLEIIASGGNPPYLYSIDNQKTWQVSNVFSNLKAGIYTVFVKSQLNSCSISEETAVIFIPNVITPNNDSFNDVFKIKNLDYFPNASISISDRFGKLVFQSKDIKNFNWNGSYLGRILPSETYWYILDFGNNYKKTGWILLKNRN